MFEKTSDKNYGALVAENRFVTDVQLAIERAMDAKGVTQADLARMLSVSEARVSQILCDTGRNLQARTIARIANVLELYPLLQLVDRHSYSASRSTKKHSDAGGPFGAWLKQLADCPTQSWEPACNDDDVALGLEAA